MKSIIKMSDPTKIKIYFSTAKYAYWAEIL